MQIKKYQMGGEAPAAAPAAPSAYRCRWRPNRRRGSSRRFPHRRSAYRPPPVFHRPTPAWDRSEWPP